MADATNALELSDSDFLNQPPPDVILGEGPKDTSDPRSEERRVGKECRSRW